jgi:UDP-glucose 4-epimerase
MSDTRKKTQKILVTGGTGYIGGATAALLLRHGHKVTLLDNLSRSSRKAAPKGARLVVADCGDAKKLKSIFSAGKFDAVMHFAAFAEVGESMRLPELYIQNNSSHSLTLLQAVLSHQVPRFVFSSTAALFGQPDQVPIPENAPIRPTNAYGTSKLQVEQMLDWFNRIHGLRYASLRYFNAAGAWEGRGEDHQPESHLIPLVLKVALGQKESVQIFGTDYPTPDGTCIRDYIHIYDLAMAHLLVLEALETEGRRIYNLGNGTGFSVREVIDTARKVTGRPIKAVEGPRRPGDPPALVASSEKIRNELKWIPKYPGLESIVQSAWEWHQQHPKGYGPRTKARRQIHK